MGITSAKSDYCEVNEARSETKQVHCVGPANDLHQLTAWLRDKIQGYPRYLELMGLTPLGRAVLDNPPAMDREGEEVREALVLAARLGVSPRPSLPLGKITTPQAIAIYDELLRSIERSVPRSDTDTGANIPAISQGKPSNNPSVPPRKGLATVAELVAEWEVNPENARKALERWRKKNAGGNGFIEDRDRRPNQPAFLYDRAKIHPVMEGVKDRQNKREIRRTKMSGERPAKKF